VATTGGTGIPWRIDRRHGEAGSPETEDPTAGSESPDPVTVGSEPPRGADVTVAVITHPAPNAADAAKSVRIVIRRVSVGKLSPGTNASCSGTRCRSFTVDERARVPFALIGVLLLVTSSTYAAGIADQGLIGEDRSVERAVERVDDADSTAALRAAARQAAHDAAAEPVTRAPDGSAAGSEDGHGSTAVRNGSAFEDAFRIRLARSRFRGAGSRGRRSR